MKHLVYFSTAMLIGLSLTFTACKKTETKGKVSPQLDQSATARQIGINFYNLLAPGTNGFKSASLGRKTNNAWGYVSPYCGLVVTTPINSTITINDTTRKSVGNSVFTYLCEDDMPNAYTLADTLTVTETGNGFNNSYGAIQNYLVKLLSVNDNRLSTCQGTIKVNNHISKINSSAAITEYHDQATSYALNGVVTRRTDNGAKFIFGEVLFDMLLINKDATTGAAGITTHLTGSILFLLDNKLKVTFNLDNGGSQSYEVNPVTGEVKAL